MATKYAAIGIDPEGAVYLFSPYKEGFNVQAKALGGTFGKYDYDPYHKYAYWKFSADKHAQVVALAVENWGGVTAPYQPASTDPKLINFELRAARQAAYAVARANPDAAELAHQVVAQADAQLSAGEIWCDAKLIQAMHSGASVEELTRFDEREDVWPSDAWVNESGERFPLIDATEAAVKELLAGE